MNPSVWGAMSHNFNIELEREADGRWIAEIPSLPGVMAYGNSEADAIRAVHALAFRVLADQIVHDTSVVPESEMTVCFACVR
jgi:predicted RNase H-like HicB family nuclease